MSFLEVSETDWIASNDLAFAIRDRFPVTEKHTLSSSPAGSWRAGSTPPPPSALR
jgi:hypothetical protein